MNLEFWSTYARCWSNDAADRAAALADVTADDVVYRDPNVEVRGRASFGAYMDGFRRGFPGHRFEIARVDAHHDRSLAHWRLVDGAGVAVQSGVSHAVHDARGLLCDVTGFFPQ
jgi:hypothetical protein